MNTKITAFIQEMDTPIVTTNDQEMTEINIREIPEPPSFNATPLNVKLVCCEVICLAPPSLEVLR